MDYAIKTLSQLRPILLGFRKSAGLTQAAVAELLGITQQSYAQLEANPASASVERLFKVMRLLNVELRMSQTSSAPGSEPAQTDAPRRQRPVPAAKKAKPSSAANRTGPPQKAPSSKQPVGGITTKKKRENW
ncbi:helix-turn-helix domain-containing protein [Paraburkholderia sp. RP-4-7]|jgi:HTH-type transcriptional regulator/antitoxin HipB|uniref:Helix-turn-helix domain-containing protein n=1 Tax=Paraburkholderia polaris TaxID=2728848 RepID=A0A848ILS7_9BURK|nr:helix-turn-helix transcriptional regulator [Paraburkholderia polaris]NMM01149.1 helix-turn-helix domain-containing protein [Paraburkholderia polaris]